MTGTFGVIDTTNDVRTNLTGTSGGTSISVATPANTVIGDTLVILTGNGNNAVNITGPTGGSAAAWTTIVQAARGTSGNLQIGVFVKPNILAADVGATFTVGTTGTIGMPIAIIRIPGADPTMRTSSVTASAANSTTSMVPVALTGVLATDLTLACYALSQNSQSSALTMTYPTAPTWTQVAKLNTVGTGTTNYNTGLVVLGKLGGGLSGDQPQPTTNDTGSWAAVALAFKPNTGGFMSFFR
jgi:hypothetical protein